MNDHDHPSLSTFSQDGHSAHGRRQGCNTCLDSLFIVGKFAQIRRAYSATSFGDSEITLRPSRRILGPSAAIQLIPIAMMGMLLQCVYSKRLVNSESGQHMSQVNNAVAGRQGSVMDARIILCPGNRKRYTAKRTGSSDKNSHAPCQAE